MADRAKGGPAVGASLARATGQVAKIDQAAARAAEGVYARALPAPEVSPPSPPAAEVKPG